MTDVKTEDLNADDVKAEDEALKEIPEDEIKNAVMEQYGITEEDNSELITKLVSDRVESNKTLSTAIKQKRNWRTKFDEIKPDEKKEEKKEDITKQENVKFTQEDIDKIVDQKLNDKLNEKEIDSIQFSDDFKEKVKSYAVINKVSIKKALESDYIKFEIKKEEEKAELEDAGISNKHDKTITNKNFKDMTPKDFDVTTEEGRKEWTAYKKQLGVSK